MVLPRNVLLFYWPIVLLSGGSDCVIRSACSCARTVGTDLTDVTCASASASVTLLLPQRIARWRSYGRLAVDSEGLVSVAVESGEPALTIVLNQPAVHTARAGIERLLRQ